MRGKITHLDCTLRDGGYYNSWDFSVKLIHDYIDAMLAAGVDTVELGLRSLENRSFKGACAYTTDGFIESLNIPKSLNIAVMINAAELVSSDLNLDKKLSLLFPRPAENSPVDLVRIACHVHEFEDALPASRWLKDQGYLVGFNLMQIADRSQDEIKSLAKAACSYPLDVLYFADSMGSMDAEQTKNIISLIRTEWKGPIGIHTHDNLGKALSNTLEAIKEGCSWVDSTVTGMGRGPGNARTEELTIELAGMRSKKSNIIPLMKIIREQFTPMQQKYGWGTNPYYYLAGKSGIHPTYIQEMLSDTRYSEEDILCVIEYLKVEGGKKFSHNILNSARNFYSGTPHGKWCPEKGFRGKTILLLGTGPGVSKHKYAIEQLIKTLSPVVLALNTESSVDASLIDFRIACHPVRLMADCDAHAKLPQPIITPFSMLPADVKQALANKEVLDFGIKVAQDKFSFSSTWCTTPTPLVMAYAFALASSGKAERVLMAGFDGYSADDPRNEEMNKIVKTYNNTPDATKLIAITPTKYDVEKLSIYGLIQ